MFWKDKGGGGREEGREREREKEEGRRKGGKEVERVINCWIFKALKNDPIQFLSLANEKLGPPKEEKTRPSQLVKSYGRSVIQNTLG